jgi:hypothetical protein
VKSTSYKVFTRFRSCFIVSGINKKGIAPKETNTMKSNSLSRLRASIAGLTFAVAAIVGAVVPAIDAAAAPAVAPSSLMLYVDMPGTWYLGWAAGVQAEPAVTGWHLTITNQATSAVVQDGQLQVGTNTTYSYLNSPPAGQTYQLRLAAIQGSTVSSNYADLVVTVAGDGSLVGADANGRIYGSDYVAPVVPNSFTGMPVDVVSSTTGTPSSTHVTFSIGTSTLVQVAEATFDLSAGNIDASGFTFGTDANTHKAFTHGVAQAAVGGSFTLYVPFKDGDTAVGICPGASSLDAVSSTCANYYYLADGQSNNGATVSIVTVFGDKYWKVVGLTGTGGYSTTLASAQAAAVAAQNNTTPDAPAPAPKAPKTGFTLGLSNPIASHSNTIIFNS